MNFAEGKGPKQVKKPYILGNFVTQYGQDGAPGGLNLANPPYTPVVSGSTTNGLPYTYLGGVPGSTVPGLNLNVNGNGATDVSFVCSPDAGEGAQDLSQAGVTLFTEASWSGSCTVTLQGSASRIWDNDDYSATNWVNISGTTFSGTGINTFTITPTTSFPLYNAYRLVASGATASGIIDWSIAGMFTDYNAMRVGANAADANGNIGQMSIQAPQNYTVQSGQYVENEAAAGWEYAPGNTPLAATKNNVDFIG